MRNRRYFGNSQQPFSITIAGTKLYILTNPKDISEAYMSTSSLSFDTFVKLLIRTCGSSKQVVERLYQNQSPPDKPKYSLGTAIHSLQVQQSSGIKLEELSLVLLRSLEKSLLVEDVTLYDRYGSTTSVTDCATADLTSLSLKKWCSEIVISAGQRAYFGDQLSEIDPHLTETFIEFDSRSWQLLYHFPRPISKQMHVAKDRLIDVLTAYFETPIEQRTSSSWSIQLFEKGMRDLGFTEREMATLMMLQYWG